MELMEVCVRETGRLERAWIRLTCYERPLPVRGAIGFRVRKPRLWWRAACRVRRLVSPRRGPAPVDKLILPEIKGGWGRPISEHIVGVTPREATDE